MKKNIYLSFALISVLNAQNEVIQLEDIYIDAMKIQEKKSKIPLSISVVDEKKYFKEGVTSLYDTLANEVGVSISGGEGRAQNITIRGISGNRIKVIKDGIATSDGYGANNINDVLGSNTFDLSNIKKIEVLKGSNSSLQGSGSLGGTVLVQTKQLDDYLKEDDTYISSISKYNGQSSKFQENIVFAKRIDKLAVGLRGNYSKSDQTKNFENNVYKRDIKANTIGILQSYTFENLYWSNTFEQFSEKAKRNEGIVPTQSDGIWISDSFSEKKQTTNTEMISKFEFSSDYKYAQDINAQVFYRNTKFEEDRRTLMHKKDNNFLLKRLQVDDKEFENKFYGTDFEVKNNLDKHNLYYGFNFQNILHSRPTVKTITESAKSKITNSEPFTKANTLESAVFIGDKYNINDLDLTLSLRYDYKKLSADETGKKVKDKTFSNFSPSLSLLYAVNNELNIYSSYNYGFKAPGADKVYATVPHLFGTFNDFVLKPNLDLKEESSNNVEIGTKFKSDKIYSHLAIFHSWYKDFIESQVTGYDNVNKYPIQQYVNIDKVKIYGFETSFDYKVNKNLKLSTSLGLVDGKDKHNQRITNLTPLEGNLRADYSYKKFDVYSRVNIASSMNRTPSCTNGLGIKEACDKSSGWATLDMGLAYELNKNMSLAVAGFNLLDKRYVKYQDIKGRTKGQTSYDARASRYFNTSFKMEF